MNQRLVEINKKRITLTERPASDVQDVFDYYERYGDEEKSNFKISVRIAVLVTAQSLRATRRNIPVYLFWKKLRYLKYTVKYLAKEVSPHVLFACQAIVVELDELNKKKVEAAEKESPGSSVNS